MPWLYGKHVRWGMVGGEEYFVRYNNLLSKLEEELPECWIKLKFYGNIGNEFTGNA